MKRILAAAICLSAALLSLFITAGLIRKAPSAKVPARPVAVTARDASELADLIRRANSQDLTLINLTPTTYELKERIALPSHARVQINGHGATLNARQGAFYAGNAELTLSDVKIVGDYAREKGAVHYTGVTSSYHGLVTCERVVIEGCYYGFMASRQAYMRCGKCIVRNAGDGGFFSYSGSFMDIDDCEVNHVGDPWNVYSGILGAGYITEIGAGMHVNRSTASDFLLAGFESIGGCSRIHNCTATDSERGSGFVSVYGGALQMGGSCKAYRVKWSLYVDVGGVATDRAYYEHQIPGDMYDFKNIYCRGGHVILGKTKLDGKIVDRIYR